MPRVKWGIGTRYCRSFQRRHSICPIRVSCITGSNQGWIGSNGIELNSIESFSTEECPRCGAIFHLDPFGSVLSSFPYSITGVGGRGGRSITCSKRWPGVRSRAGNIWAKDPKEDFREFKATVSPAYFVDVESFWNRLLFISCDNS